jgi:hypothetical protein
MNIAQRIVLILGFVAILGIGLFPPWTLILNDVGDHVHAERPAGYHFLFGQHVPQDPTSLAKWFGFPYVQQDAMPFFSLKIDSVRLLVQLAITLLLTWLLYFAVRPRVRIGSRQAFG